MGRIQPNVLTHKYRNFSTLSILVSFCHQLLGHGYNELDEDAWSFWMNLILMLLEKSKMKIILKDKFI